MRQRALLTLLWLAATAAATAVGLAATQTVGDVIRDSGPVGPVYPSTAPPPTESAPTTVRSRLVDGAVTLTVECTGRVARLVAATPAPGWRIVAREVGPDEDVDVDVQRGSTRMSVEAYCNGGEPRAFRS